MEPQQAPGGDERHPIRVVVTDDLERSRLTVFFRLLLAIPLFVWFGFWSIAAFFIAIVNWIITLVQGHSPQSLHDFYTSYIRFSTHLHAYLLLAADPYPGFSGRPGYPVDVEIDPPATQGRWGAGFRIVLAVPAFLLASSLGGSMAIGGSSGAALLGSLTAAVAFLGWCFVFGTSGLLYAGIGVSTLLAGVIVFLVWSRRQGGWPFGAPASATIGR